MSVPVPGPVPLPLGRGRGTGPPWALRNIWNVLYCMYCIVILFCKEVFELTDSCLISRFTKQKFWTFKLHSRLFWLILPTSGVDIRSLPGLILGHFRGWYQATSGVDIRPLLVLILGYLRCWNKEIRPFPGFILWYFLSYIRPLPGLILGHFRVEIRPLPGLILGHFRGWN